MKILVTGATGLIGSNVVRRLAEEGHQVIATVHEKGPVAVDDRIQYINYSMDLRNEGNCRRAVKECDVVIHAAASTSGAAVIQKTPMVHVTPNILMNTLLLAAAYEAGVKKFIWFASTTGYPDCTYPVNEEEMFDGEPFDKYWYVGHMKRFTEILCQMYGRLNPPMQTVVLRPTNVYGPNDDYEFATAHVTASLIRKVVERHNPLIVWGTGKDLRDLIYVDDMVDAVMAALKYEHPGYDAFNIGFGKVHSVNTVLKKILEIDGYNGALVEYDRSKPTMIPVRRVDVSKATRALGFKAKTKLEDGLRKTIEWYRETKGISR